jgi:hypothetical protein
METLTLYSCVFITSVPLSHICLYHICAFITSVPFSHMCLYHICVFITSVPLSHICLYHICAYHICVFITSVPLSHLCLYHIFAFITSLSLSHLCLYLICAFITYVPLSHMCLYHICVFITSVPLSHLCSLIRICTVCFMIHCGYFWPRIMISADPDQITDLDLHWLHKSKKAIIWSEGLLSPLKLENICCYELFILNNTLIPIYGFYHTWTV